MLYYWSFGYTNQTCKFSCRRYVILLQVQVLCQVECIYYMKETSNFTIYRYMVACMQSPVFYSHNLPGKLENEVTRITWYQMQVTMTGIKMINICQAPRDMGTMIPSRLIIEKENPPTWYGILKSTAF